MISIAFDERRRAPRRPAGHIGAILTEQSVAPRYCLVIDQSDHGVQIRTTSDFKIPERFVLHHASTEGSYQTVWRRGVLAGAQLISRLR